MALLKQTKENDYYISTWKHNKPIPTILETCTIHEFETILELSSEALKSLRESATTLEFQSIIHSKEQQAEKKRLSELEQLKQQYEKTYGIEQSKFQKQLKDLQIQLEQSTLSYQALNQNYLNLQNSSQETFNKSLNSAIGTLESQHTKAIISIESKHTRIEEIYKSQIQNLQQSLDQYTNQAITQNVSSNKGKSGEQSFDVLVEQFTTWTLENTSKTPQSCDRFGVIKGCKTLFEIKNYSSNVPKKEIDKFKRDMEVHSECPLGVFLSLTSSIVGAPQDFFYTEFSPSNQLLIYIQQFDSHYPSSILTIIDSLIDLAKLFHSKCSNSEETSNIQSKVDSIKPIFDIQIKSIANIIKDLTNNTKFIIDSLQKNNTSIKTQLDSLNLSITNMFQTLFKEHSNSMILIDSSSEGAAPPPKKKQTKRKNDVSQTILNFTNILEQTSNNS